MLIAVKLSEDVRKQISQVFLTVVMLVLISNLGVFICCCQEAEYSLVQCNKTKKQNVMI